MEATVKSLEEKIAKAEESAKGKEGAELRDAKKAVKRLQRKRNRVQKEMARIAASQPKPKEEAAPAAEAPAAEEAPAEEAAAE